MSAFFTQLKWQFLLLQKNSIISISTAVTFIYAILLYFLRDINGLDQVLISLVLNDPSVIGFFFIALAIYTEIKYQVLPAIFVTPLSIHLFLFSKLLSISILGTICSLGLAFSVVGFDFDVVSYTLGSFSICLLSAMLGIYMLTYAEDFLKFALMSIPVFLGFTGISLLIYLGVIDIGNGKYLFPIQGSLDLIDHAISGTAISHLYSYASMVVLIPLFYWFACRRIIKEMVHQ